MRLPLDHKLVVCDNDSRFRIHPCLPLLTRLVLVPKPLLNAEGNASIADKTNGLALIVSFALPRT